jgi:hypothetical protein
MSERSEELGQELVQKIYDEFHSFGGFRTGVIRDDIIAPFIDAELSKERGRCADRAIGFYDSFAPGQADELRAAIIKEEP